MPSIWDFTLGQHSNPASEYAESLWSLGSGSRIPTWTESRCLVIWFEYFNLLAKPESKIYPFGTSKSRLHHYHSLRRSPLSRSCQSSLLSGDAKAMQLTLLVCHNLKPSRPQQSRYQVWQTAARASFPLSRLLLLVCHKQSTFGGPLPSQSSFQPLPRLFWLLLPQLCFRPTDRTGLGLLPFSYSFSLHHTRESSKYALSPPQTLVHCGKESSLYPCPLFSLARPTNPTSNGNDNSWGFYIWVETRRTPALFCVLSILYYTCNLPPYFQKSLVSHGVIFPPCFW